MHCKYISTIQKGQKQRLNKKKRIHPYIYRWVHTAGTHIHSHTHTHKFIYIGTYCIEGIVFFYLLFWETGAVLRHTMQLIMFAWVPRRRGNWPTKPRWQAWAWTWTKSAAATAAAHIQHSSERVAFIPLTTRKYGNNDNNREAKLMEDVASSYGLYK